MDWRQFLSPEVLAWLWPAAGGLLLGVLIASLVAMRRIGLLRTELAVRETRIKDQQALDEERQEALQRAEEKLAATFGGMANQSLRDNTENFLKLAREHLGQHQEKARGDLQERQKAIETLVNPIREALQKTEQQIAAVEKERRQAYGSIREQLASMSAGQASLQAETRNLVNALRRPEVRGQWGELTLRRLAELAGMVEYCDFYEQESSEGADGRMRPDMIIRMPNGRELIVDVKTPLDAYLNAMEASDDVVREAALKKHAENVRDRVRELSLKSYWSRFERSPEFVILFIPGDQFLSAALQRLPNLLEEALHKKVILATPTSLVALLKAVAYGWRQVALEENAKKIQAMGEELHRRLGVFSGHLSKLGRQLGSSVDSYNAAVGSLERNVLPGARKFTELGVSSRRDIEVLNPVESVPRRPDLATDDLPDAPAPLVPPATKPE